MKFLGKARVEADKIQLPEKVLDFLLVTDGDEIYFYEDNGKLIITRYPAEEAADVTVEESPPDLQGPFGSEPDNVMTNMFRGLFGPDQGNLDDAVKAMEQFLGPLMGNISQMMKQFQDMLTVDTVDESISPDESIRENQDHDDVREEINENRDEKVENDAKRVKINIMDDDEDSSKDTSG